MGMMNVCLSHDTAFHWLMRNRNPRRRGLNSNARVLPLSSPSRSQSRAILAGLSLDDDVVEVLVCRSNGRRHSGCVKSHLSGTAYPSGSFVRVPVSGIAGVYSASPELVFRQIAAKRSLLETVYVGYALCSSYRVDDKADGGIALREGDDEPLTTVERIEDYLRKTEGSYGCAKARRALSYVREGSTSPMESALAMGLGLPLALGGFGAGDIVLRNAAHKEDADERSGNRARQRCLSVRMDDTRCGKQPVSMVVLGPCDVKCDCAGPGVAEDGACDVAKLMGHPDVSVTASQVYEFSAYVQLCEKICRCLARRDAEKGRGDRLSGYAPNRREAIRSRQAELWRTLVCFSSFRQAETGGCVEVFDVPVFE